MIGSRFSFRTPRVRQVAVLTLLSWALPAFVGGYALLTMYEFHAIRVPGFVPHRHLGLARYLFDPWQHWDGQWFLRIAEKGYAPDDASPAFLPTYPWLVRTLASLFGGDTLVAACVLSWLCLAVALFFLAELLELDLGEEDARAALVLLITFPTAFFFHAVYTESLFLLLTVLTFHQARKGEWFVAAAFGFVATLTRWTGVALVPALLAEAWCAADCARRPDSTPRFGDSFSKDGLRLFLSAEKGALLSSFVPALAIPFAIWNLEREVGDGFAFSRAQRLWERRLTPPWTGLIDGITVLLPGHPPYLEPIEGGFPRLPDYPGGFLDAHAYNLVAALGGLALAYVAAKHLRPSYGLWALGGVVIPLMTPSTLQPLQSMPRFVGVVFPVFMALAVLVRNRPMWFASAMAIGAVLQGFFAARFALWFWVA